MRSVKECLKRVLGKALLGFEELATMLTEVEAVLNSRPLSYVHDDASEPEPLTPSHFLTGKRLTLLPAKTTFPMSQTTALNRKDMGQRWKYRQTLKSVLDSLAKRLFDGLDVSSQMQDTNTHYA